MIFTYRNVPVFLFQLLLGNEFFDLIDRYCLINRPSCTFVLAPPVTDRSAYNRKRIFMFDQFQGIHIPAIRSHLNISLNRKVCRARCFTWRCPRLIAVYLCMVSVIRIPLIPAPFHIIRKQRFRVFNLAVFCAKLLSQLCRSYRTDFNALPARYALCALHMRSVSRP